MGIGANTRGGYIPPTAQPPIINTVAIAQNQWYDVWTGGAVAAGAGSIKKNIRLIGLSTVQAVGNETIEIRVIADNLDETPTRAATAGTIYYLYWTEDPADAKALTFNNSSYAPSRAFMLEAKKMQLMYRKTTAVGANNNTLKVIFAQW